MYAIASGVFEALGYGYNVRAVLAAAAARELTSIARLFGDNFDTLDSANLGDLMVTCNSHLSRNFKFGCSLISGSTLDVKPEGYTTVAQLLNIIDNRVDVHILKAVYYCIYEAISHEDIETKIKSLVNKVLR